MKTQVQNPTPEEIKIAIDKANEELAKVGLELVGTRPKDR